MMERGIEIYSKTPFVTLSLTTSNETIRTSPLYQTEVERSKEMQGLYPVMYWTTRYDLKLPHGIIEDPYKAFDDNHIFRVKFITEIQEMLIEQMFITSISDKFITMYGEEIKQAGKNEYAPMI